MNGVTFFISESSIQIEGHWERTARCLLLKKQLIEL